MEKTIYKYVSFIGIEVLIFMVSINIIFFKNSNLWVSGVISIAIILIIELLIKLKVMYEQHKSK